MTSLRKFTYQYSTEQYHIVLLSETGKTICNIMTLNENKKKRMEDSMVKFPNAELCQQCSDTWDMFIADMNNNSQELMDSVNNNTKKIIKDLENYDSYVKNVNDNLSECIRILKKINKILLKSK